MGMGRYSPAWDYGYDGMGLSEMGLVEWLNGYVEVSERKGGAEMGVKSNDRERGYVSVGMKRMGMKDIWGLVQGYGRL